MKNYPEITKELRKWIIEMITAAKTGHPGGSLSAIDLLSVLWFDFMRGVDKPSALPEDRDRFVLSKGHGVPALYAILAKKGFISPDELPTLRQTGSRLQGHPDRVRLPIVEASTGSLGQGLSVAQGVALALRMDQKSSRIFCLMGDGEMQEGQVWEALMSAPKFQLSNLCAMIDYNNAQIDGPVSEVMPLEPITDKLKAFGWNVIEINGHDFKEIHKAYTQFVAEHERTEGKGKPMCIVARTIKGKGVSFMENKIEWHGSAPNADQAKQAIQEILNNG